MPPPPLRCLVLLVPVVLLTLSPTKSAVEATDSLERSPSKFEEVNITTSASPTSAATEFAADPRYNVSPKPTPPPPHQPTPAVNSTRTTKRKRPRIRLIKVYKKVWRHPKRKSSTLDGTNASNRTLSRKQPTSITVIELPLKPVPEEEKIESILQLQQSSDSFKNASNDNESSEENENERSGKQNTLPESPETEGDIKESRRFINETFERSPISSRVGKEKLVPSSETQSHSDKKSGISLSSTRDEKNSTPNPSYRSDLSKNEDSVEEYKEVSRANQNSFQRNKGITSSVVERFLDILNEEIQDLNRNISKPRIPEQNMKKENNENITKEHNSTSEEQTVAQDLNCTTDTNSSDALLQITSCQNDSTPNEREQTTQSLITLIDNESTNRDMNETSTGVSENERRSKTSTNSNTTNDINIHDEIDIENKGSTPSSNQYNRKQHTELINESGTTTELNSKGIIEEKEMDQFAVPVGDVPASEKPKDSINVANYYVEMKEINRSMPEIFDEVISTEKPGIIHSSVNFEDATRAYGSISTKLPNQQDNIGDSRSIVEHINPNVSELSTSVSIKQSTESDFSARNSEESSRSDTPIELSSKSRVEEVMERGLFTIPEDDVSTMEHRLESENSSYDTEKSDISMTEIITIDDVNSTTAPGIIHSSVNFEDATRSDGSISTNVPNHQDNIGDSRSIVEHINSNVSESSTSASIKESTENDFSVRNSEERSHSDTQIELSSKSGVEEAMERGHFTIPDDDVSTMEQRLESENSSYDTEKSDINRSMTEIIMIEGVNSTAEPGLLHSSLNSEAAPRAYDSISTNVPNHQDNIGDSRSIVEHSNPNVSESSTSVSRKESTESDFSARTLGESSHSDTPIELDSKSRVEEVMERGYFIVPEDDGFTEQHLESETSSYDTEKSDITRNISVITTTDYVNSTTEPGIIHSSVNFEDSSRSYGSISTNVPNHQDNIGDSRSIVEHINPNVSESSTGASIKESTESDFSARNSEESSHSDTPIELGSKIGVEEVMERGYFAIPKDDVPTKEQRLESENSSYDTEKSDINRSMTEIIMIEGVNSTAEPGLIHSSVNSEAAPRAYGSISTNVPNHQDNIGDSRSLVEHINSNVSESSTSASIKESTESDFSARNSEESSHSDTPIELGSKIGVEEVMERGYFAIPKDDVPTKEQRLESEIGDYDIEKSDINRSMAEIITVDDVNSTTEPRKIHKSANFKDTPQEYDSISAGTLNLSDNVSDTYSIDRSLNFSVPSLSTVIPTNEMTERVVTERKTEERFDSDFTTEFTSQGMVKELTNNGQLSLSIDNMSSEEQHQDSIRNANDDPVEEKYHRDVYEIFDDGNTTEPNITDSLENFEMVENTLRGIPDSEVTTELSSNGTIEKELENINFLSLLDSENYKEQNETSVNERAYFIEDNSTSESRSSPQTDKETNEYEPIVTQQGSLISSSSINKFFTLTHPESSTSLLVGEHNVLENETFTYSYTSTDFSSEEDEGKDLLTISDVESRKNEHGNVFNEENSTENYLDNYTRETDSSNASNVLADAQNEYIEMLSEMNPLDNTHSTNESSDTRNSDSPVTSTMEISSTENRQFYMYNVTNNENISPKDVIGFREMSYVSVSPETTMSPIEGDGTTPEIHKYSDSESTFDFNSAVFANVFKNTEYPPVSNRDLNRNEDTNELPPWARSQTVSFDVTDNSVKFLPEESKESMPLSDVIQEHTKQSLQLRTENQHLNKFYQTTEIASEKRRESLDQVENKNDSDRDMASEATEQITVPVFSENNPESQTTVKYSEIIKKPTILEENNYNSEVTQGMVSSDQLKITHNSSIYSKEEHARSFTQKETNINNIPTFPQTRRYSNDPKWLNNQLSISATESLPTTKADACQTQPKTSNPPKTKHSRIHTIRKDLSKMKNIVRDEVRRVLSQIVPIDKTFYRNVLQASSILTDSAPNEQATQQTNKERPFKYRLNKKLEITGNSPGKHKTHSRHNTPRVNSNRRSSPSSRTLPTVSSKKELPTHTYSSKYPVCFCPPESRLERLITNNEPKANSPVFSFYNRRIQPSDEQSVAGKLHTGRSQFPPFESLTKQRQTTTAPFPKTPSETYLLSSDFTEDGVPDSKNEALIQEVENRPRTLDVFDYDDDTTSPPKKHSLEVNIAFHPRIEALMTPARYKERRGFPTGARIFLGESLVRSPSSLPTQYAMKTGLTSSCYCIPASIFDPLPNSPLPSPDPTSSIPFPTPLLNPAFASIPTLKPAPFIPNSLIRLRFSEYFNLNSIPVDGPNLMQASLPKFSNSQAPISPSGFNPTLIPPSASTPASNSPPGILNPRPVSSFPVPNPNPIPVRAPALDSILGSTSGNFILDPLSPDSILSQFRDAFPDTSLSEVLNFPSGTISDPFTPILSSIPTSTTSFMPRIPSEDQQDYPFYLSNAPHSELTPVSAPFVATTQTSAIGSAPIPVLVSASSPAHVSAPEHVSQDTASFDESHSWTGGDPWDLPCDDKSTTKPMHTLPFDPTSIPSSPSPLLPPPPPLQPPPLTPPQPLTFSPTSLRLLQLLRLLSLPPSTPLLMSSPPFPSSPLQPPPPPLPKRPPHPYISLSQLPSSLPPRPLLKFQSIPLHTPPPPPPPLAALVKPRLQAPILPLLMLETKPPNLPPEALQSEFELPIPSSTSPALSILPPSSWLPPPLLLLFSPRTQHLPLPPPSPLPLSLPSDQPVGANPCTHSLQKWYAGISSPPPGPNYITQQIR